MSTSSGDDEPPLTGDPQTPQSLDDDVHPAVGRLRAEKASLEADNQLLLGGGIAVTASMFAAIVGLDAQNKDLKKSISHLEKVNEQSMDVIRELKEKMEKQSDILTAQSDMMRELLAEKRQFAAMNLCADLIRIYSQRMRDTMGSQWQVMWEKCDTVRKRFLKDQLSFMEMKKEMETIASSAGLPHNVHMVDILPLNQNRNSAVHLKRNTPEDKRKVLAACKSQDWSLLADTYDTIEMSVAGMLDALKDLEEEDRGEEEGGSV